MGSLPNLQHLKWYFTSFDCSIISISGLCLCKHCLELIKHGNPFTDSNSTIFVPSQRTLNFMKITNPNMQSQRFLLDLVMAFTHWSDYLVTNPMADLIEGRHLTSHISMRIEVMNVTYNCWMESNLTY